MCSSLSLAFRVSSQDTIFCYSVEFFPSLSLSVGLCYSFWFPRILDGCKCLFRGYDKHSYGSKSQLYKKLHLRSLCHTSPQLRGSHSHLSTSFLPTPMGNQFLYFLVYPSSISFSQMITCLYISSYLILSYIKGCIS